MSVVVATSGGNMESVLRYWNAGGSLFIAVPKPKR